MRSRAAAGPGLIWRVSSPGWRPILPSSRCALRTAWKSRWTREPRRSARACRGCCCSRSLGTPANTVAAPRLRGHVAASVVGPRLCLVVGNSHSLLHADLSPADFGQGLGNVEQRLLAAYGADARLTRGPDGSGGTAAFVDLPRSGFWLSRAAAPRPP